MARRQQQEAEQQRLHDAAKEKATRNAAEEQQGRLDFAAGIAYTEVPPGSHDSWKRGWLEAKRGKK